MDPSGNACIVPLHIMKSTSQTSNQAPLHPNTVIFNGHADFQLHSAATMTPPLTPQGSVENFQNPLVVPRLQFHSYLRAYYPFHPPCDDGSSSTVTLPLNQGDVIFIHSIHDNGWADGTLLNSGHRGWLPTNYCEAYEPQPVQHLLKALTHFWDIMRESSEGSVAAFCSQDCTRGLIAGVRYLLVCCYGSTVPTQTDVDTGQNSLPQSRRAFTLYPIRPCWPASNPQGSFS